MTNKLNKGGFTLIELLVVVLIIGILSSIALPQYTKAVEKSRSAEAMTYAADWVNAQAIYKMANGKYAQNESNLPSSSLDITLPSQLKNFTMVDKTGASGSATLQLTRVNSSSQYQLVVTMTNNADDGSDTITRTCNGKAAVCNSIVSGLNNAGSTAASSGWKYGSATIAS